MAKNNALDTLSFETALQELETIVRDLETGKSPLEESIDAYARGIALKNHCEKKLKEAQSKIEKITIAPNGSVTTQPFDIEQ